MCEDNGMVLKDQTDEVSTLLLQAKALSEQTRRYLHDLAQPLTIISATFDLIEIGCDEQEDLDRARAALTEVFKAINDLRTLHVQATASNFNLQKWVEEFSNSN
jgi:signal transduction histidine kinase